MLQRIGPYHLKKHIASGGMAEVWLGLWVVEGRATKAVAIKVMNEDLAKKPEARERFQAEAELGLKLGNKNIVTLFSQGEHDGLPYLVMEWVDGFNLFELLAVLWAKKVPVSLELAAYIVGEILRGLDYAHTITDGGQTVGVIHRDICPQNILISNAGEVKIADFGVARIATDETKGLVVRGHVRYMPPEQAQGRARKPAVDLFPVGAILWELLAGTQFRGGTNDVDELAQMAANGTYLPLDRDDVPEPLLDLLVKLLAVNPRHRFQSAEEALQILEAWPGYRHVQGELSRLCRKYMGVRAPRSGLQDAVAPPPTPSLTPHDATVATVGTQSETVPRVAVTEPEPAAAPEPVQVAPDRKPSRAVPLAAFGALALVGGLTVWGLAPADEPAPLAAAAEVPEPEPGTPAAPEAAPAPAPAPTAVPEAAPTPEPDPTPEAAPVAAPVETEPLPANEPKRVPATPRNKKKSKPKPRPTGGSGDPLGPAPTPKPKPEPTTRPTDPPPAPPATKPEKASVKFVLGGGARLAYVRVDGGRVFSLEPFDSGKLAPGKHMIHWRLMPDDPWKSHGTVTLEPGVSYKLKVTPQGPELIRQ